MKAEDLRGEGVTSDSGIVFAKADESTQRKESSLRTRVLQTAVLIFSWICLGLYNEILGPTLPTLMDTTGSNYEEVGRALSVRSIGLLCGSLIGGWAADMWVSKRAYLLALSLSVGALTTFLIPWCTNLSSLTTVLYVAGCSHGFLTTNGNPLLASIWGPRAAGPFSLMHAGYGVGGAIAPLLTAPFTKNKTGPENLTENYSDLTSSILTKDNTTDSVIIDPVFPYSSAGGILLVCAFCLLFFNGVGCLRKICTCGPKIKTRHRLNTQASGEIRVLDPMEDVQTATGPENTPSVAFFQQWLQKLRGEFTKRMISVYVCTFVMYFAIVGNERVFGKFVFTYALYGPVKMNAKSSYMMNLMYWLVFGGARVVNCLASLLISPRWLLGLLVVGTLLASVGLIIIPSTVAWFYVVTFFFGFFKSPLFPSTLSVINRSCEITGLLVLIVNLGQASGASLLQYVAGYLIQRYGQIAFPYLVCATACVVVLTAMLLILLLRTIGDRFEANGNFDINHHAEDSAHANLDKPDNYNLFAKEKTKI
ncbi:unnamed protein product [Calicophoron daubneyi]|uniref:Sodium-dependent glucose transporter 1 n=1 Tax=Calicophoron daubneyi TaxID=300641 RepID=A0AAV2TV41_CALDB